MNTVGYQLGQQGRQAASSALATAAAVDPEPFSKAALAIGALLVRILGGGCGPACIRAADTEQVFEAAADNFFALAQHGVISVDEAIAGMQSLAQQAQQAEAQLGTHEAAAGAANAQKTIQAEIAAVSRLTSNVTQGLDQARQYYLAPGTSGWYADSLTAAGILTDQFLSSLPPRPAGASAVIAPSGFQPGPRVAQFSSAAGIISGVPNVYLLGAAAVALALLFGHDAAYSRRNRA